MSKILSIGPNIKYQQSGNQWMFTVYELASTVHHVGRRHLASEIRNMATRLENKVRSFGTFLKYLQRKHKALARKQEDPMRFDLLNHYCSRMVLCCLHGEDGMEDHCIALYNNWIFDSNFKKALLLTRKLLDLCCSTDDVVSSFRGCTEVVTFPNLYKIT